MREGIDRGRVGGWVVAGALGLVAIVPYVDAVGVVPLMQALVPVLGAAVLLALLVGLLVALVLRLARRPGAGLHRRRIGPVVVAGAAALAMVWPVAPPSLRATGVAAGGAGAAADSDLPDHRADLSVLALNTEYGQADPGVIVREVRERGVDVLILLEVSPQLWQALQAGGLGELLPHATGSVGADAGGSIIAAATPLTCRPERADAPQGSCGIATRPHARGSGSYFDQPVASLSDGTVVRAAHPWPPRPYPARWRAEQADLQRWIEQQQRESGGGPFVVAGDFNSGPVHPAFRELARGLDRAPRRQLPWPRTWPRETGVPPFVAIDHILARGRTAEDEAVIAVPGTDHAAVWARLRP